jgi:hypothetical protein
VFEDQVLPSGSRHTVSSSLGGERGSHRAVLSNGGPPHVGGRGAAQGASIVLYLLRLHVPTLVLMDRQHPEHSAPRAYIDWTTKGDKNAGRSDIDC